MTEPIDPIELYVDRKVLDDYALAVEALARAVHTPAPHQGKVGRALNVAVTNAQTAQLWLNCAEEQALADARSGAWSGK